MEEERPPGARTHVTSLGTHAPPNPGQGESEAERGLALWSWSVDAWRVGPQKPPWRPGPQQGLRAALRGLLLPPGGRPHISSQRGSQAQRKWPWLWQQGDKAPWDL